MRQDRKSLSLMGMPDLPVEAFQHVGNRKIKLHGGGNPISDLIDGVVGVISDIGSSIDDMVHDVIPGGWATVAAVTLLACGIPDPELLAAAEDGTLTTGMLENAGYDALTVADSVAATSPEVTALTQAAVSSGIPAETIAMANATADPIAALNAAAGWTASDPLYLMSIGYTGAIVDPITGMSTDVTTAAKAQSAGWESAGGAHGAEYIDGSGTYYNSAGQPVAYTQPDGSVLQAGQTAGAAPTQAATDIVHAENGVYQNGVRGDMVTYANGQTEFIPSATPAPVAPEAIAAPANQSIVAGTNIGQQIPGAYSVDSAGVYYDVNGQVVATTQANGGVVGTNGLQLIDAPVAAPAPTPVAPTAPVAAPAPTNTIPVTLGDGSVGAFDPATGTVYNSAGAVDAGATETMQTAASGSTAGPGTQLAEAAKDTAVASDAAPFRVEVTGAAGTAESPMYAINEAMTPGSQLATQAQIDAGAATWNPAANAWEVVTPTELSPVVPEVISSAGGGAVSTLPEVVVTAPAVTGGLTTAETAGLAGAGLVGASALGGGGAAAATPAATTGGSAVTGPVTPGTSAPATVVTPTGDVVATTTTPPVQAPLTPVQPEVIPPGSSTVTPVEVIPPGSSTVASVTAPPAGVTTAEGAAAAGYDAATIAKWVAGGLIAAAVLPKLLAPPVATPAGYGPLNKHYPFGTADKLVNPGLNPGWITAQPFYNTTSPVQSQYYWGNHPYTETPADLANWNNIPYAPAVPWGLQQPQAPFDVNTFIAQNTPGAKV